MIADDKKMELMKKLQALAERGERGEREAARRQLERLMEKYNVDEAGLSDDTIRFHWYTFKTKEEKKLLFQVFYKVAPKRETFRKTAGKGRNTQSGIKCTDAEALQIEIEYEFYKELFHEELDLFLSAFIQKHEIFDMSPGHKVDPIKDMEKHFRMGLMADAMQNRTLNKMLTE